MPACRGDNVFDKPDLFAAVTTHIPDQDCGIAEHSDSDRAIQTLIDPGQTAFISDLRW